MYLVDIVVKYLYRHAVDVVVIPNGDPTPESDEIKHVEWKREHIAISPDEAEHLMKTKYRKKKC